MKETLEVENWEKQNKEILIAELDSLREKLEKYIQHDIQKNKSDLTSEKKTGAKDFHNSPLNYLCKIFNLSEFEREILLLCAGVELDSRFPILCAKAQADSLKPYCTFSLALSVLSEPHWSALNPYAPLRRWKLIEHETGQSITSGQLYIDERILHYLTGISFIDERLEGIISKITKLVELTPSNKKIIQKIVEIWEQDNTNIIQLIGSDTAANQTIAHEASALLHLNLFVLKMAEIPNNHSERLTLSRLWEREALLNNAALLIDCEQIDDSIAIRNLKSFLKETRAMIILSGKDLIKSQEKEIYSFDVNPLSFEEQYNIWIKQLEKISDRFNGQIEKTAFHFQFNPSDIHSIAAKLNKENGLTNEELKTSLWNFCRTQSRRNLENLAQRIESGFTWNNIVLPEFQLEILKEIAIHLKESYTVYEKWGFKGKGLRGLGISALFTGVSGTGKTLAAEILSNELQLDLYRIDLSSVVSKYIGETEKNLKRVFDAAEESGAILLFDEADALFGKRSEVKDSHDRYANIEVSYLLQRMELYKGLAILTTNFKNLLDTAFLRRIRFIIQFPFPDNNQREKIWRNIFPKEMPLGKLDFVKLARLNVTGGNIRNIALNAAFIAANNKDSLSMHHILHAVKNEYAKLEKTLSDSETEGWI